MIANLILILCAIAGAPLLLLVVLPAAYRSLVRKASTGEWQFRASLRLVAQRWVERL